MLAHNTTKLAVSQLARVQIQRAKSRQSDVCPKCMTINEINAHIIEQKNCFRLVLIPKADMLSQTILKLANVTANYLTLHFSPFSIE